MHMILRYSTGRRVDAVLLAGSGTRLRLAVPYLNETIELRLEEGEWFSEQGNVVEIESMVWDGQTALPQAGAPRVRTAGS